MKSIFSVNKNSIWHFLHKTGHPLFGKSPLTGKISIILPNPLTYLILSRGGAQKIILPPTGIYLFKFHNKNIRTMREIYSKLTVETPERRLSMRRCSTFSPQTFVMIYKRKKLMWNFFSRLYNAQLVLRGPLWNISKKVCNQAAFTC